MAAVIACGALAREVDALRRANGWTTLSVRCLPASLHNRPERIPAAVRDAIRSERERHDRIFVAYGDCGTGGMLDAVLRAEGVERLPGAHCYEFYAGSDAFLRLADDEPGTFYLTDFLARHFERLVIRELGIDRHPHLRSMYFGNYRRLVHLAQAGDPQERSRLREMALAAAGRLGLAFVERDTGPGELGVRLVRFMAPRVGARRADASGAQGAARESACPS